MSTRTDNLKNALVKAMIKSLGIVSDACKICGCSRNTYYEYYNNDPDFKEKIDDIAESNIDLVESRLFQLINGFKQDDVELFAYQGKVIKQKIQKVYPPDKTAIIFYLKTKGKDRGYIESTISINKNAPVDPFEGLSEAEIEAKMQAIEEEENRLKNFKSIPNEEKE